MDGLSVSPKKKSISPKTEKMEKPKKKKKKRCGPHPIAHGLAMVRAGIEEDTLNKSPQPNQKTPSPKRSKNRKRSGSKSNSAEKKRKLTEKSSKTRENVVKIQQIGENEDQPSCSVEDTRDILQLSKTIDHSLETKAKEYNLSAINVKSILKHMIKYPSVMNMLLGVEDSDDISSNLKFTRARAKQLVKKGNFDWPMTPLKEPVVKARTFLDVEYSDDSASDVDYDPKNDPTSIESDGEDEEDESVPNTPAASTTSSMPPPSDTKTRDTDEPTCLATRSRVQLVNFEAEELERQLFAVDPDARQLPDELIDHTNDIDTDPYYEFLTTLNLNDTLQSRDDDEANDPEYNFQEDLSNIQTPADCVDEFRMDKSARVTKREVHDLMLDLADIWAGQLSPAVSTTPSTSHEESRPKDDKKMVASACQTEQTGEEEIKRTNVLLLANIGGFQAEYLSTVLESTQVQRSDRLMNDEGTAKRIVVTVNERLQLEQQLRMHVQLLLQMYVLTRVETDFEKIATESSVMLEEINGISLVRSGYFGVNNLGPALELVRSSLPEKPVFDDDIKPITVGFYKRKFGLTTRPLRRSVCTLLCCSTGVLYPQLVPLSAPQKRKQNSRVMFTQSEDCLIAMGMSQFKKHPFYLEIIHNHLLPIKTPKEIYTRYRALANVKGDTMNPIKYFRMTGGVQDTVCELIQCVQTLPIQWPAQLCPPWMQRIQERGLRCMTEPGLLRQKPGKKYVKNVTQTGKAKWIRKTKDDEFREMEKQVTIILPRPAGPAKRTQQPDRTRTQNPNPQTGPTPLGNNENRKVKIEME